MGVIGRRRGEDTQHGDKGMGKEGGGETRQKGVRMG